jgi:hypothetical protein
MSKLQQQAMRELKKEYGEHFDARAVKAYYREKKSREDAHKALQDKRRKAIQRFHDRDFTDALWGYDLY